MNKIRILIFVTSLILLGWIFTNNLKEIDFAKTENDAEFYRKPISQVESSNNLNDVKAIAIEKIESLKKSRDINSENGILGNWIIVGLTILNIGLFLFPKNHNKK